MRIIRTCIFLLAGFAASVPAHAHELWLSPKQYDVAEDAAITANIRVGERFSGTVFAYIPRNFSRFALVSSGRETPIVGRLGDVPAVKVQPSAQGLATLVYVTTPEVLTYYDWKNFEAFVRHKALANVIANHRARGLPERGFKELYLRFAKSLIAVGHGKGRDMPMGLETEIVAETNPYTDDLAAGFSFRVLYQEQPRRDAQVEVFAKDAQGNVTVSTFRTDNEGRVRIPVVPGTEYLIDAVAMRPLSPADDDSPVWESLWASLTFQVPALN